MGISGGIIAEVDAALDGAFTPSDVLRGRAYAAGGRVELLECEPTRVLARVRGGATYRVELALGDDGLEYGCSCPAFERAYACKHLWAVIELARRRLAPSTVREDLPRAPVPAPTSPRAPRTLARMLADADEPPSIVVVPTVARRATAHGDDSWRRRLAEFTAAAGDAHAEVDADGDADAGTGRARARPPVVFGLVPTPVTGDARVVVLAGRSSGRTVRWRALRRHELAELAPEDRELALSIADASEDVARHAQGDAWEIAPALQALVLPRLVATGRFHLVRDGGPEATALALGAGEPWHLRVALRRADGGLWLRGEFAHAPAPVDAARPAVPSATPGGTAVATSSATPLAVPSATPVAVSDATKAAVSDATTVAVSSATAVAAASATSGLLARAHGTGAADDVAGFEDCDALLDGGWFVHAGRLERVAGRVLESWAGTLHGRGGLRAPEAALEDLLEALDALPRAIEVDTAEVVADVASAPRRVLRVFAPASRTPQLPAEVVLEFDGALVTRAHARFVRVHGEWRRVPRDATQAARAELESFAGGTLRAQDGRYAIPPGEFAALVARATNAGWRVEAEGRALRCSAEPNIVVRSGIDWFDVDARVDFGPASAHTPELLRALRERSRYVELGDGSLGLLPERWLRSWEVLAAIGRSDEDGVRVARGSGWLLSAWVDEIEGAAHVDADASFAALRARLEQGLAPRPLDEPEGFQGRLRPYQREGLGWLDALAELGLGGCLADDMGLGKTVMVLALVQRRRASARAPALVVAPASVAFNWEREARRFTPGLRVHVHHGNERDRTLACARDVDLIVTTYGMLRSDAAALARTRFDCVVLDEAQTIKNPASQAARAARALDASARLALTGTPLENHLGDLFSIFQFAQPDLWRGSPRVREWTKRAPDDVELARVVARGLRPFLLRRRKEDVLTDLPAKSEQIVACELPPAQRRLYDDLRRHYRDEILGGAAGADPLSEPMNVLEALLRLRQAACHPALIDSTRAGAASGKLDALVPMLEDVVGSGHKGLVFSQFTSFLALVRARLDERGIAYEYLDGRTRDRAARVDRFQSDAGPPLFLVSLKAGGTGLNLTAADYVFLLDPWWNPAVEAQAVDRSHRIGQTRAVTAYRFVAQDTVEEKVLALQEKKRALANALFDAAGATLRDLTRADVEWLLA